MAEQTRWMDATAQAEAVSSGEVTARELVEAAISRIEADDGALNAVVLRWFDHALDLADQYSPSAEAGPFGGVPFLLKDLWARYEGMTCSHGNRALKEARPIADGDDNSVAAFKRAGLITMGRTNSPEMGSLPNTEPVAWGPTRNPWDLDRTPGGSSGGAAAAVATGFVPIAHASDGGGSIRIPASCCGLVGLKPSRGRISTGPTRSETGLGVEFAVTRSVRDSALLLDAVSGPGVGDAVIAPPPTTSFLEASRRDPGRLRIGLLDHHPVPGAAVDPIVTEAAGAAATLLASLGHDVEASFPAELADADFARRFSVAWSAGRARAVDYYAALLGRELTADDVEPHNWAMYQFAVKSSAIDLNRAEAAGERFARDVQVWWSQGWDLLLTPTLGRAPLAIGGLEPTEEDPSATLRLAKFVAFTPAYNVSGQPAINLPLYWTDDGLPIGVQLVAAYGREDLLLSVASQLEATQPWADRHPTLPIGS